MTIHAHNTPAATPAQLAEHAAEAVRAINHLTLHASAFTWPAQVSDTIGQLAVLTQRLPQALIQMGQWLDTADAAGRVGHDTDDTPNLSLLFAWTALASAEHHATQLAAALADAHNEIAHLTGIDPDAQAMDAW